VQVDTLVVAVTHGDRLLLCSDGLHNYLDDKDVPVAIQGEAVEVPPRLIHFANDKGGKDNISAILLDFAGDAPNQMDAELPIEAMSAASLFQHMSYKEKSAILAVTNLHDYKSGEEIVSEGDTGDDIFVVVQGTTNVMKQGIIIAELGPGGHFGEMGLVDHTPRSATVRAKSDCSVLIIRRPALMAVMRKEATIGVKLLWGLVQTLSARLRVTNTDIVVLKQELAATMSRRDLPFEPATSNMRAPFDPSATMKSATPISTAVPPTRVSTPPPVSVTPASRPVPPGSRPAIAPRPPPAMLGTPATQRPPSTPRPGSIKPPSKR
jgi:CRP-like cAMP-binding protein